jgi:hypothetical protein
VSAVARLLREELELAARRLHDLRQLQSSEEHRWWKFGACPAQACAQSRLAMLAYDAEQAVPDGPCSGGCGRAAELMHWIPERRKAIPLCLPCRVALRPAAVWKLREELHAESL